MSGVPDPAADEAAPEAAAAEVVAPTDDATPETLAGAEATVDGHEYFVGNHRFTHELAVCTPEIERQLAEIEAAQQLFGASGWRDKELSACGRLGEGESQAPSTKRA